MSEPSTQKLHLKPQNHSTKQITGCTSYLFNPTLIHFFLNDFSFRNKTSNCLNEWIIELFTQTICSKPGIHSVTKQQILRDSRRSKKVLLWLFQMIFFGRVKTDKEAGSFVTKYKLLNIKFIQLLYTRVVFLWLQSSCFCNIIKYSKILARSVSSKRRLFYCSCFKLTYYSIRNWFCQQIYHFYTQD